MYPDQSDPDLVIASVVRVVVTQVAQVIRTDPCSTRGMHVHQTHHLLRYAPHERHRVFREVNGHRLVGAAHSLTLYTAEQSSDRGNGRGGGEGGGEYSQFACLTVVAVQPLTKHPPGGDEALLIPTRSDWTD